MKLYIGSLGRVNDIQYLARLAKHAYDLDPEVRFAVIGSGAEEVDIRKLADELGVLHKNFFMLGEVPKVDAVGWFSASTMTVCLANAPRALLKDSTGNKYFDSLAASRPVACNYTGWQVQIAADAGAGIIIDSNDYAHAASQLVKAIRDKEWLAAASAAARRLAESDFSRDSHATLLETVLIDALRQ